jgi:hypothetical protein
MRRRADVCGEPDVKPKVLLGRKSVHHKTQEEDSAMVYSEKVVDEKKLI